MSTPEDNPPKPDFSRLLVQHDRAVLRYIMTFMPRHDDAEEVLQRVATVLWEKFNEYDPTRDFLPWALRVAYFEVLNFRKEAARSRLVFSEEVIASLAETRDAERPVLEAQQRALQECLGKLNSDSAVLLRRRYCDAQTVAALAAEWGKSVKSLYRRLDRLRDLIAECVERRIISSDGIRPAE
jgi:RNA polymerase sigma-70 factor, ECF subfamily